MKSHYKSKVLNLKPNLKVECSEDLNSYFYKEKKGSLYFNDINSRLQDVYNKKQWGFASNVKSRLNILKEKISGIDKILSKEKPINRSLIYTSKEVKNQYFLNNNSVRLKSLSCNKQNIEEIIKEKADLINSKFDYFNNYYNLKDHSTKVMNKEIKSNLIIKDKLLLNSKSISNSNSNSISIPKSKSKSKSKSISKTEDYSNLFLTLKSKSIEINSGTGNYYNDNEINHKKCIENVKEKDNYIENDRNKNVLSPSYVKEYMTNNNDKFLKHVKPLSISSAIIKL